jgi:hypothetical protein
MSGETFRFMSSSKRCSPARRRWSSNTSAADRLRRSIDHSVPLSSHIRCKAAAAKLHTNGDRCPLSAQQLRKTPDVGDVPFANLALIIRPLRRRWRLAHWECGGRAPSRLRLIASSNTVGVSTGKSAGLAPLGFGDDRSKMAFCHISRRRFRD